MHNITYKLLPLALLLFSFVSPGKAALVGTTVDGSLTFGGDPSNYFDPGYGFVPTSGYLNASGTTVTVSASAVEFGYQDISDLISADFSNNQIIISEIVTGAGPSNSFEMIFTDPAFTGQYLIPVSDNFPLNSYSLADDVLTLDYPGGNPAVGQTLTAAFTVAPVPEPSTACFLSVSTLAILALVAGGFRRKFLVS